MTRIAEYPPGGITDAEAWHVEVGLVAYEDEQLTLKQLAAFLKVDEVEAIRILKAHDIEIYKDLDWLEEELAGSEAIVQEIISRRNASR